MNLNRKNMPTESELEILQIIWQHGPSSVRFVNNLLNEQREVGYTTTLKIMQIMTEKGLVSRDTSSRTHVYDAEVLEQDTQHNLLNSFIKKTYRGSAMKLVMQALGQQKASADDIEKLKAIIEDIENQNK
ncbi:MAG: BlaI/MecI/CopY family transcriptional regulator [Saprospiraceae bacterium]|nr:BlaI/MecI/CopY family transcriptional regulator [Bacteroidia bacterium]NNE16586.1 BlaI/MecI/CopY family transcriptional regulator [Saprospiraceae bacterium]NNL92582.1 BlaI/MecI/CopY family transcriptional regulator [Saprospiraceae bacterium]